MTQISTNYHLTTLELIMQKLKSRSKDLSYFVRSVLDKEHETVTASVSAYNDLVYVDESEICLKTSLCSKLFLKDQNLSVESIRFFTSEIDDKIEVCAGVNVCIRPSLPNRLQISKNLEFKFPDEERRAFDRQYGEIRWFQEAVFESESIGEVVDKLITTFVEIENQW